MYFGCHNHTEYSNITTGLDSINKLPDLVAKAKELGMSGLAITNHDNLSEVIEINRMQKKLAKDGDDFVLAIGNEIYLVDSYDPDDGKREKYFHFILIAKDKIGYQALIELSSRAWYRSTVKWGKRRVPTLKKDIEDIIPAVRGHVVAATACLGGELPTLINENKLVEANMFLDWCEDMFGYDDFYVELQPSDSPEQIKFNKYVDQNLRGHKIIITTDAHYQDESDFPIFEAFLRSQQEKREVKEYYTFARMMDEEEIYKWMRAADISDDHTGEYLDHTVDIGKQIEFYDLAQDPRIPGAPLLRENGLNLKLGGGEIEFARQYPTINWALDSDDEQTRYCIYTCLNTMKERDIFTDQYMSRLEEEFDVFKFQSEAFHDNFFKYFNTMQHYLDLAWSIDCAVGPSRGSASGCLICYLMDVVQCDPIQYNLPFWRFANKVRTSPLDIDTDFQPSRRPDLFAAIRAERGELGMTQVATYRTLTLKAAIGNAGRGYRSKDFPEGLDPDITTYISSLIEIKRGFVATLKQTLEGDETTGYSVNTAFIKECNQYPGLLDIIKKIEGLIVGSSTHAAAVILFDDHDRLIDHCSLMRAPNGDLCTALDLHTVEEAGCYKYDFLLLSTLDIQATCFKLLQADNVIDPNLTLKECFRKYINPNTIDFDNPDIWNKLYNNEVLSIFQWDAASGRKGILATRPQNLFELTSVNGLIRLMTQEGEEDQIQRFCRIKERPQEFEDEMVAAGLSDEQRKIMHEELDQYNGCAATQESFMVLSQRLANYTLKQADALRKTVAKKKMSEIEKQKELFYSQCEGNQQVKDYLWRVVIQPSLGYGFSLNHALPYSIIGVQCILMGGILFHPIYWQAACLLQRSGSLDGKSANYNKIAKAVSALSRQGVHIAPLNINKSERDFKLDAENNTIYFGFAGTKGLKDKAIDSILEQRPFNSFYDFLARTSADITSIVTLVKAGAFDDFGDRYSIIDILAKFKSDQKEKLNGQNYSTIERLGLWPEDGCELTMARRVFNFTRYLKSLPNGKLFNMGYDITQYYPLDERAIAFLDEIDFVHDGVALDKTVWKSAYDVYLKPMKQYLIDNQTEMVNKVNEVVINEWKEKYFPSDKSLSQWEIETMGLCFGEHPMRHVINVDNFDDLPTEPQIATIYKTKQGRTVPLYRLTMIIGIVIAKDKLHSSITLLTADGPVEVKFRKQQFASYDAQISKVVGGKKQVVEKSWLNRGNGLIIHGMRQDDQFVAKTYKNSPMKHTAYKVTAILDTGKIEVQKERKKGKQEESLDDEA